MINIQQKPVYNVQNILYNKLMTNCHKSYKGVLIMFNLGLSWLRRNKKKYYVMRNDDLDIEITCSKFYVKNWKLRGFRVVRETWTRSTNKK